MPDLHDRHGARLPAIDALAGPRALFSAVSITTAFAALVVLGSRLTLRADVWHWWAPLAFMAGMIAADFGSGIVHWGADTWGRDDLRIVGPRLLVPFRVHHINPEDFLRRSFVDTNGEVAFAYAPVLIALCWVPLDRYPAAAAAVFGFAFCGVGMMTNQIHQWAHMPSPPPVVRMLQDVGIILGRGEHATHHERPYDARYCITTGWCNGPLEALGFFRRLERAITALTGVHPRQDDDRYQERYGATASLARND